MKYFILVFLFLTFIGCSDTTKTVETIQEIIVDDLSPITGSMQGGSEVKILGKNFTNDVIVYFNDVESVVKTVNQNEIIVTIPPSNKGGLVDVEIKNSKTKVTLPNVFKYIGLPINYNNVALFKMVNYPLLQNNLVIQADVDNNNFKDIIASTNEGIVFYLNQNGSFTAVYGKDSGIDLPDNVKFMAFDDLNKDGLKDLFISGDKNYIFKNIGETKFELTEGILPEGSINTIQGYVVDYDNDTDKDLILLNSGEGNMKTLSVLTNDGTGIFVEENNLKLPLYQFKTKGITLGDFNNDSFVDIFASGYDEEHKLFYNDGTGIFRIASYDIFPKETQFKFNKPQAGDLDGDNLTDLYLLSEKQDKVYINDGNGKFVDKTQFMITQETQNGKDVIITDFDKDKCNDIIIFISNTVQLWHNDCEGHFFNYTSKTAVAGEELLNITGGFAFDFDNDFDNDLFFIRNNIWHPLLFTNLKNDFLDTDKDGIADDFDNCSDLTNIDQKNSDLYHFSCLNDADCLAKYGCSLKLFKNKKAYLVCDTNQLTYNQAEIFCEKAQGKLVTIESEEENTFLTPFVAVSAYIGFNDLSEEGVFKWLSGKEAVYTNWNEGEPNDSATNEDCGALYTNGKWNDLPCTRATSFICEDVIIKSEIDSGDACDTCLSVINFSQADSDGDKIGDVCDNCPNSPNEDQLNSELIHFNCVDEMVCYEQYKCSLYLFKSKYYLFCNESPMAFADADNFCKLNNSKLVVIETAEENQFIQSKITGNTIIGFTDTETEGTFKWIDNSFISYTNWRETQPDDYQGAEDCGMIYPDGTWNDAGCESAMNFICETESVKVDQSGDVCK